MRTRSAYTPTRPAMHRANTAEASRPSAVERLDPTMAVTRAASTSADNRGPPAPAEGGNVQQTGESRRGADDKANVVTAGQCGLGHQIQGGEPRQALGQGHMQTRSHPPGQVETTGLLRRERVQRGRERR